MKTDGTNCLVSAGIIWKNIYDQKIKCMYDKKVA